VSTSEVKASAGRVSRAETRGRAPARAWWPYPACARAFYLLTLLGNATKTTTWPVFGAAIGCEKQRLAIRRWSNRSAIGVHAPSHMA